ncbi:hypothetical protein RE428_28080 [Marinobacter nanhaiticus D15-8W]|uniref:Uncharacterized protein n=1 Tax=Marinobacter nanhaiticus D15-8W TaxID=626887 RepID=N6VW16_9GAMM|nr:hypothetical protein [Marinobacter nanhaiticus]ENO14400.1 hypothetical protein J057_23440 [Marinobacter nanhaiticus D15-8W]BES71790.1 hypothetical protein RE428_28080 [Marinobacter nanhaiticus D15-8W]
MRFPQFLDIEFVDTEELCFPTAIAWSLADGSMKTVVIEPDEAWLPDDPDSVDVDLRYLQEQGVPLLELARELNEDLSDQTIFVDGLDPDEGLVDLLFDAIEMPVPFELATVDHLVKHLSRGELEDWRRELLFTHGLDPQLPESGVFALLMLARDEGLIPEDGDL